MAVLQQTQLLARRERATFAFLLGALLLEMVFFIVLGPLLPHYASQLHLSKLGAGVLSASYSLGCGVAAVPAGMLAGRVGARALTVGGLLLVGVACAAFALGTQVAELDAARALQGVGAAGLWAGAIGWLMDLGGSEDRGSLIGIAFSAAGVGACVGPAIGALATLAGPRPVFLVLAVLIVAMAGAGAMISDHPGPRREAHAEPGTRATLGSRVTRRALAIAALPSLAYGVAGVLVPLRLHALGVGSAVLAAAYIAASVLETLVNPLVGRWYDRSGGPRIVRLTLLASIVCLFALGFLPSLATLLVALIVSWPVLGSAWVPALADLTAAMERSGASPAFALGVFNLCWAVFQSLGAIGGAQLGRWWEAGPFVLLAALYAAALHAPNDPREGAGGHLINGHRPAAHGRAGPIDPAG
jgi:MFS family permease